MPCTSGFALPLATPFRSPLPDQEDARAPSWVTRRGARQSWDEAAELGLAVVGSPQHRPQPPVLLGPSDAGRRRAAEGIP